jgi:hypothetical protein
MAKAQLAAMHIEGTEAEIAEAMKTFLAALPPSDQTVIATATPDAAQKKTTQGDVASPSSTDAARVPSSPGRGGLLTLLREHSPLGYDEMLFATGLSRASLGQSLRQLVNRKEIKKNANGTYSFVR